MPTTSRTPAVLFHDVAQHSLPSLAVMRAITKMAALGHSIGLSVTIAMRRPSRRNLPSAITRLGKLRSARRRESDDRSKKMLPTVLLLRQMELHLHKPMVPRSPFPRTCRRRRSMLKTHRRASCRLTSAFLPFDQRCRATCPPPSSPTSSQCHRLARLHAQLGQSLLSAVVFAAQTLCQTGSIAKSRPHSPTMSIVHYRRTWPQFARLRQNSQVCPQLPMRRTNKANPSCRELPLSFFFLVLRRLSPSVPSSWSMRSQP